jgi:hypothetical protein
VEYLFWALMLSTVLPILAAGTTIGIFFLKEKRKGKGVERWKA